MGQDDGGEHALDTLAGMTWTRAASRAGAEPGVRIAPVSYRGALVNSRAPQRYHVHRARARAHNRAGLSR